jgi:hypothetical protein
MVLPGSDEVVIWKSGPTGALDEPPLLLSLQPLKASPATMAVAMSVIKRVIWFSSVVEVTWTRFYTRRIMQLFDSRPVLSNEGGIDDHTAGSLEEE